MKKQQASSLLQAAHLFPVNLLFSNLLIYSNGSIKSIELRFQRQKLFQIILKISIFTGWPLKN